MVLEECFMYFFPNYLRSFLIFISVFTLGQQAFGQSAIPKDQCAIITGATKDPAVALKAIKKFKNMGFFKTVVIESSNGFLAPSVGIIQKDIAKDVVTSLAKDKIIPDDAYCGNADRFISILYPDQNFNSLTTTPRSAIAEYGLIGQWNTDPNMCGMDSEGFLQIGEKELNFMFKSCNILKQYERDYSLNLEMNCFAEGDEWRAIAEVSDGDHGIIIWYQDEIETVYQPCFER